ncbi:MAG: T9SS type A sorting domain-containing protein, partial [Bacteroidales bacterium]|nr:T9SS type A sorting domain-containing protein [Bacteroidales bacterium]
VHILKIDSTGWYNGINTGITPYETPKQILVYPNPVKNEVKFVLGLYSDLVLNIYNSTGHLVINRKLPHTKTINIAHLPKGLYIYILKDNNNFFEKGKLIKQ